MPVRTLTPYVDGRLVPRRGRRAQSEMAALSRPTRAGILERTSGASAMAAMTEERLLLQRP